MFDAFRFSDIVRDQSNDCPLLAAGRHVFRSHGLSDTIDVDFDALDSLLQQIEKMMPNNSYHNRTHVLDVVQSTHAILLFPRLAALIPPDLKVAVLLAACIHDLEHRGVSNDYLEKTHDAWVVDGQSGANECHHAKVGLELLEKDECAVLKRCPAEVQSRIKSVVRKLVLDTDMKSAHKPTVTALESLAAKGPLDAGRADDETILQVLSGVLKISDLGHSWTTTDVHYTWVCELEDELFTMGDLERAQGLPVSPMCDRNNPSLRDGQVWFFDNMLLPLFRPFCTLFPECSAIVRQAQSNRDAWKEKVLQQRGFLGFETWWYIGASLFAVAAFALASRRS
jgi:cAMP-specific phosphodiesterase 4